MPVAAAFLLWTALSQTPTDTSVLIQFIIIVGITWISGLDYLLRSLTHLRVHGVEQHHVHRLLWVVGQGALVPSLTGSYETAVLPILMILSAALATGGVDNVVVAVTKKTTSWPFFYSGLLGVAFFSLACWPPDALDTYWVPWIAWAIAISNSIHVFRYFSTHRSVFSELGD